MQVTQQLIHSNKALSIMVESYDNGYPEQLAGHNANVMSTTDTDDTCNQNWKVLIVLGLSLYQR